MHEKEERTENDMHKFCRSYTQRKVVPAEGTSALMRAFRLGLEYVNLTGKLQG